MNETDKGKALAEHLGDTMFETHRGAFVRREELVIYGNDGYGTDERARREVDAAQKWAIEKALDVTDFGLTEDGYSWALACRGSGHTADELAGLAVEAEDLLWCVWLGDDPCPLGLAFKMVQMGIAMTAGEWPSEPTLD
jgi:hypothetical protein